jgi:hypothetical protein
MIMTGTEREAMTLDFTDVSERIAYDALLGTFTWKVRASQAVKAGDAAGWICPVHGYRKIRLHGKDWHANKIAILLTSGAWPASDVDHINGDQADDRLANLRVVTHQQNMWNTKVRADSHSGLKGAFLDSRSGKYRSAIKVNGKRLHLGTFDTAEKAHEAYCHAAAQHFGEFARFA